MAPIASSNQRDWLIAITRKIIAKIRIKTIGFFLRNRSDNRSINSFPLPHFYGNLDMINRHKIRQNEPSPTV